MLPINDTIILLNTNCTGQEEIPVHYAKAKLCEKQLYNYSSCFISYLKVYLNNLQLIMHK